MLENLQKLNEIVAYHLAKKHAKIEYEPGCSNLISTLITHEEITMYGRKKLVRELLDAEPYFEFKGNVPEKEGWVIYTFNLDKYLETVEGKNFLETSIKKEQANLDKIKEEFEKEIQYRTKQIQESEERLLSYKSY